MFTSITVSKETLEMINQCERLLRYLKRKKLTHDETIKIMCELTEEKYGFEVKKNGV